jgi:hypothetical protein
VTRQPAAVNVGRGGNAVAGRPVPQGLWKPDHDRICSYSAGGGAAAERLVQAGNVHQGSGGQP